MSSGNEWRQLVSRLVKSEMTVRGVKYQTLSTRLEEIGVSQTADNLRNKVNKGIMGADLLLQIFTVLNARAISSESLADILTDIRESN